MTNIRKNRYKKYYLYVSKKQLLEEKLYIENTLQEGKRLVLKRI